MFRPSNHHLGNKNPLRRPRRSFAGQGELLEAKLPLTGNLDGVVFHDANTNGFFELGEVALPNSRIHLDSNGNGQFDETLITVDASDILPRSIPESGTRRVNLDVPSTGSYIVDVDVNLTINNFFGDLLTVQLEGPDGTTVTLINRFDKGLSDATFDDSAPLGVVGVNDVTDELRPIGSLSDFEGREASGQWTLIATLTNAFIDRDIEAWSLDIKTTDEPIIYTGDSGQFRFSDLPAGTASLNITPPEGFRTKDSEERFEVTIVDDQLTPLSVPMTQESNIISGVIHHDSNANRITDRLEGRLSGWTVYADTNSNDVLDEDEIRTESQADNPSTALVDETGLYTLTLPEQGNYNIRAIPPEGEDWDSYPLTTGADFEVYGTQFFSDFVQVRSTSTLRRVAGLQVSPTEMDYSLVDEVFYTIESETRLGTFDLETEQYTTIGSFVTATGEEVSMAGISVLPNGELRGSNANGLYLIDKTSGIVELLHATTQELSHIDYGYDGRLYGFVVDSGLWELDPETGEGKKLLLETPYYNGIDVAPNQSIYFPGGFDRFTRVSPLDGRLLEDREISDTLQSIASLPDSNWDDVETSPGRSATGVDFAAYQTSSIQGRVLELLPDDAQIGLPNQTVYADLDSNGRYSLNEPSDVTSEDDLDTPEDESGNFELIDLPAGTYQIRQVLAPTLDQLSPEDFASVTVEAIAGQVASDVQFVNATGSTFSGNAFWDANGDGTQGADERRLDKITIYTDLNNNGQLDDREWSSITQIDDTETGENELGQFEFGPLTSVEYSVRAVVPHGWIQTTPQNSLNVVLPIGQQTQLAFGLVRGGTISGSIFSDVNNDGERGLFERQVEGATAFLDLDGDSELDEDEPSSTVDENGFHFNTLPAGEYSITTQPIDGFDVPPPMLVHVELDTDVTNVNFAARPLGAVIAGTKWWDTNENGERDADELGLSGFSIYVDLNANGELDLGEPTTITSLDDFLTPEDETGTYRFEGLPPGTYQIREIPQENWLSTSPNTTTGRMFTINAGVIEERDPDTAEVIHSFARPGDVRFSSNEDIGLGPNSLFLVADDSSTPMLWELDPDTGDIIDVDELPFDDYLGVAYLNERLYLKNDFRDMLVWDPATDTHESLPSPTFFDQFGLASSETNGLLYNRSSSGIDTMDPETLEVLTTIRAADSESVAISGETIYATSNNTITKLDINSGRVVETITLGASRGISAIAVGDVFPQDNFHIVEVNGGQTVVDIDFGTQRQPQAEVSGFAWLDENGDGIQNDEEATGLEGVRIRIERIDANATATTATIDDLVQTPNRNETGSYSIDLSPGMYRITASHPDMLITSPTSNSRTTGFVYQLVERNDELQIAHHLLGGSYTETLAVPEQPRHIGPQGLAVTEESIFYVDGSYGAQPRLWQLDRTTGEVVKFAAPSIPTSHAAGLATFEDSLFVVGDSNTIEQYSTGDFSHRKSIPVELGSIGGIVADATTRTLVMAGFQNGEPKFARVGIDDGIAAYYDLDAPVTGGIAIVNGVLLTDGTRPQVLRRFDLETLAPVGTQPLGTFQPSGLASLTPQPNSHYVFVPDTVQSGAKIGPFDFGLAIPETLPGDLNGDGEISRADADLIYAAVLANEPYNELFDLNDDGAVDAMDINSIANQLVPFRSGDVNLDGKVGFDDFLVISVHFGQKAVGGLLDGDVNQDGVVSFADFLLLSSGAF